jgi:hypothetical protein
MTRINVHNPLDGTLDGWFDPDKAERFDSDRRWDGHNRVSVITGSAWVDEWLYRTRRGRWVLNRDSSRYNSGPFSYEFVDDNAARDWLLRSEGNDDAAGRFFGDIPEESGPGRPEIGGAIHVRLGELLADLDAYAQAEKCSRAEAVRRLIATGIPANS